MKMFVCDLDKCNGCHSCQIVCKDEHCDTDWAPYAAPQPDTGQFWMNVKEKERGQVPVVRVSYTPTLCSHCADCLLIKIAPDAVYQREDGLVIIDPEKAKGREDLVKACPLGAVFWNKELQLPQKCTGCAHLLDSGWEVPRCVDVCPTGALRYVDSSELDVEGNKLEGLDPVKHLGPRVLYKNLPKRFVAGCLVDFARDEVVIGAAVHLKNASGEVVQTVNTDELGDFIFEQVEAEKYTLEASLSADDICPVAEANLIEEDLCLGDLEFSCA